MADRGRALILYTDTEDTEQKGDAREKSEKGTEVIEGFVAGRVA